MAFQLQISGHIILNVRKFHARRNAAVFPHSALLITIKSTYVTMQINLTNHMINLIISTLNDQITAHQNHYYLEKHKGLLTKKQRDKMLKIFLG